jgi:hypothetical protein
MGGDCRLVQEVDQEMNYAPIARIVLRYGVGAIIGASQAELLAGDPDVVAMVALAVGSAVEAVYVLAKRRGWAT